MATDRSNSYDWKQMSLVEAASGIEVICVAKMFRDDPNTHKHILMHALDEYRHSSIFQNLSKKYQPNLSSQASTSHGLINVGGLDNSPFPATLLARDDICSYLYVGEKRALSFNSAAKSAANKNMEIVKILNDIELDEISHASGLKKYLDKRSKIKISLLVSKYYIRYFFADRKKPKFLGKVQQQLERLIVTTLFKVLPRGMVEIKAASNSLEAAIYRRKELI